MISRVFYACIKANNIEKKEKNLTSQKKAGKGIDQIEGRI